MRIPEGLKPPVDEWVIVTGGLLIGVLFCVVLPIILWMVTS